MMSLARLGSDRQQDARLTGRANAPSLCGSRLRLDRSRGVGGGRWALSSPFFSLLCCLIPRGRFGATKQRCRRGGLWGEWDDFQLRWISRGIQQHADGRQPPEASQRPAGAELGARHEGESAVMVLDWVAGGLEDQWSVPKGCWSPRQALGRWMA